MRSTTQKSPSLTQALLLLTGMVFSLQSHAGSPAPDVKLLQLTFQTDEDKQGRVLVNSAGLSRIEVDKHNAHYLLFDPDQPGFWMVDMGKQHLTDAHDLMFTGSRGRYYLDELGPGEPIAGMPTRIFSIENHRGEHCAHYHIAAEEIPKEQNLAPLQALISQLALNPSRVVPALGPLAGGFISPCLRAELDALPQLATIGLPLKRINQDDEVAFVITEIATTTTINPCLLALPEHYEPKTPAEVALEALKDSLFRRSKPDTDHIELTDCP